LLGVGVLLSLRSIAVPLDIQRLSVQSVRGEPLRAVAVIRTESREQIAPACLSLGDESDLPFPDYPLLRNARIMLSPAGDAVEITTVEPVRSPGVAVVLRVQCPGEPLTARHFNLLIRQPWDRPPAPPAEIAPPATLGMATRLTLLHDETVASIARAIHPTDAAARQELEKAIVAANPNLFPQGKPLPLKAGTRVLVPEVREPRQLAAAAQPGVQPPDVRTAPAAKEEQFELPPKLPKRLRLKLSRAELNLKRSEGISEVRRDELRRAYRGEVVVVAAAGTEALELKIAQLRESQGLINTQLARLEQAVESLRRSVTALVSSGPPKPPPPPPPPLQPPPPRPVPELLGLPMEPPWIPWAAAGAAALLLAAIAFLLGRRSRPSLTVDQHEARIDALLQEAREAAGPLLAAQVAVPPVPREFAQPTRPVRRPPPPPPPPEEPPPPAEAPPELAGPLPELPDYLLEGQAQAPTGVDLEVEPGPEPAPAEPQTGLKREMDMALDNSRSMFTDVDRFIAMGRTQNAISLLEFQIQRDPNDRDSWVKLMAVYRQEGMETEFQRTYAEFRRRFPGEV
jgi:hypothetical protein